jgi:hypothetical protein
MNFSTHQTNRFNAFLKVYSFWRKLNPESNNENKPGFRTTKKNNINGFAAVILVPEEMKW